MPQTNWRSSPRHDRGEERQKANSRKEWQGTDANRGCTRRSRFGLDLGDAGLPQPAEVRPERRRESPISPLNSLCRELDDPPAGGSVRWLSRKAPCAVASDVSVNSCCGEARPAGRAEADGDIRVGHARGGDRTARTRSRSPAGLGAGRVLPPLPAGGPPRGRISGGHGGADPMEAGRGGGRLARGRRHRRPGGGGGGRSVRPVGGRGRRDGQHRDRLLEGAILRAAPLGCGHGDVPGQAQRR